MALLTVLLLVAVMSVLAVAVLDDIRFGVRRAGNAAEVGQAQWYAIGAEQLARGQIRRLTAQNPARTLATGGWNGRVFSFPIEGGLIRARIADGGNCFDLNSVVQGPPGNWTAFEPGVAQFRTLLAVLGTPSTEATSVSTELVRWIDVGSDSSALPGAGGAYRSGDTLLAEVSELRAIGGVTPQLYDRLRPHVCALPRGEFPVARLSPINVNTLRPDGAVLITVLTDGVLSPDEAQRWLATRPAGGWSDANAFFSHPLLADRPPAGPAYGQVNGAIRSRFFALDATVTYGSAEVAMSSLFEQDDTGSVRLAARRWTADE